MPSDKAKPFFHPRLQKNQVTCVGEMLRSARSLKCKKENLGSSPRTCVKKPAVVICACDAKVDEVEKGGIPVALGQAAQPNQ